VWVDAGRVLDDVIELIGDVAAGSVPLEIVSEVVGSIKVFRFHIPVKVIVCFAIDCYGLCHPVTISLLRTQDRCLQRPGLWNWVREFVTLTPTFLAVGTVYKYSFVKLKDLH